MAPGIPQMYLHQLFLTHAEQPQTAWQIIQGLSWSPASSSYPTNVSLGLCQGITVLRLVKLSSPPTTAPRCSVSSLITPNAKAVIPFLFGSHLTTAVIRPKEMEFANQDYEFISYTLMSGQAASKKHHQREG